MTRILNAGSITYRKANPDDAGSISRLILDTQAQFTFHEYSPEGIRLMNRLCSEASISAYLARGDIYLVADLGGVVIGVIGIRDASHVAHNFVSADHHNTGISSKLWELGKQACVEAGNPGHFELRASTFAIPIYEHWGFEKVGGAEDTGGIISTPMVLDHLSQDTRKEKGR